MLLQLRCEAQTRRADTEDTSAVVYAEEFYGFEVEKCYIMIFVQCAICLDFLNKHLSTLPIDNQQRSSF